MKAASAAVSVDLFLRHAEPILPVPQFSHETTVFSSILHRKYIVKQRHTLQSKSDGERLLFTGNIPQGILKDNFPYPPRYHDLALKKIAATLL